MRRSLARKQTPEKFSKRTRLNEQLARERYTVLEAEARDLVKKTGMDFADAFAQVKGKLGAKSREAKSVALLDPEEQLANWRAQMTPEERASLKVESVKGSASQNLLEGPIAKNLALEHLFERASVARDLHAAGMLLRRGTGRVSVDEARVLPVLTIVLCVPDRISLRPAAHRLANISRTPVQNV